MKINELDICFSEKVTDRFIDLCKSGKISYPDELRFFEYLENKYKPMSIPDYCKLINRNHKLVNQDFDNKKLSGLIFAKKKFVYSLFN